MRLVTLLSLLLIAIGPLAQTFQTTNLAQRLGVLFSQIVPDSKLLILGGAMVDLASAREWACRPRSPTWSSP